MLAEGCRTLSPTSMLHAGITRASPSATTASPSSSMWGSSTANSSPPRRATRSVSRSRRVSARATAFSVSSPALWPWRSLTLLKLVEVDHHQAGDLAVALRAGDLQLEVVLEQPAVAQAGERVVVGEVAQVLLELLALGDVLQLGDVVQGRAVAVAHERHRQDRRDGLAGGVEVALLDLERGDLAGEQALALLEVVAGVSGCTMPSKRLPISSSAV